jgi:hypothetical protein
MPVEARDYAFDIGPLLLPAILTQIRKGLPQKLVDALVTRGKNPCEFLIGNRQSSLAKRLVQ